VFGTPSRRTRRRLEETGVRAPATVLEIATRGWAVTSGPSNMVSSTTAMLKTTLRVEPAGEPAFEVTRRMRYAQLSIPTAGAQIRVIYDHDDHDALMLDTSAQTTIDLGAILSAAGIGSTPDDRLDELEQLGRLHATGVLTDLEFAAEKRRILEDV
jgi:hypothetical protein